MASNETQEVEQTQEQPRALIADENTMTIWGETVGTILGNNKLAFEEIQNEIRAQKAVVDDLNAALEGKDTEIKILMDQLKATRERVALLQIAPIAFTKLPDGSIRFQVTLDPDAATPYLEQADGAQEDPATYVPRQVAEALAAYSFS